MAGYLDTFPRRQRPVTTPQRRSADPVGRTAMLISVALTVTITVTLRPRIAMGEPVSPKAKRTAAKQPAESLARPEHPNVLVILLDDAGFADPDTFGGEIHTPTLTRIAETGIVYNAFHTTAISSATRASLLTGRNHHHVGNGTITELANSHAGYTGVIPPSAATIPEVLKPLGYVSAAFGKWHNTPVQEATPAGPFNHWPTGYGFDHFYGFNGGESDQYRPRLFDDTRPVEPPRDPRYHLTEDLANKAIDWLERHHAAAPRQPFFLYWAPGAVHAPHQIFKEWADRYKGHFDDGWDAYRARVFARQKAIGWIPPSAVNTPRPPEMRAWASLSPREKRFQARLMEVYAGFLEHTDAQAGRIVDALERLGQRDDTLIFYVFSDNGASSEGMQGSINNLVGLNGITTTPEQNMQALDAMYGGLEALGGPKLKEHYNAAWAWAGETPFIGTKLVAGYFGGTRVPLAISWPRHIAPSKEVRTQFHHVDDLAPTIYEVVGASVPAVANGVPQEPLDGVSMAYTFSDAKAATHKPQQYFEMMGSRAEYADGWVASVFGPRRPWVADQTGLISWAGKLAMLLHQPWLGDYFGWLKWHPADDRWSLYDLKSDFSEAHDVADQNPARLADLRQRFADDARRNQVNPVGASFDALFHPIDHTGGRTEWHFASGFGRLPELAAPNIKSRNNVVTVDADVPVGAHGVLFKLGEAGGGIALYVIDGMLTYEYNAFSLTRTRIRMPGPLPVGHDIIEAEMTMNSWRRAGPATVVLRVNDRVVASGEVPVTAPIAFSATGTFDVGQDAGSPVSLDYFDRAPFAFNGRIRDVKVQYR